MDDAVAGELVDEATRLDMFVNDLVVVKAEGSDVEIASLEDVKNIEGKVAIGDAVTVPAGKYANQALNTIGLYTGAAGDDGEYAPEFADRVALADKVGTAAYANQALNTIGLYTGAAGDDGEYAPEFADRVALADKVGTAAKYVSTGDVALADKVGTAAKYVSTGDATIGFVYSSDIFRYDGIEQAFVCPEDAHKPIVYPGAVSASSEHAAAAADFLDFCLNDAEAQKVWAKYGFELFA